MVVLFLSIYAGPALRKDGVEVGRRRVEADLGLGPDLEELTIGHVEKVLSKVDLLQEQSTCVTHITNWVPPLRIKRSGDV